MKAETLTAAAFHIGRVKSKLASGVYATEPSTCICGAGDAVPVAERDRYGIPHRMVLCGQCGLVRADPRMTRAAYETFYETEYRPIYDGWQFGPEPSDHKFMLKALEAQSFRDFLEFFDCAPKVVFEYGSGGGELLDCLRHAGVECVGVDLAPAGTGEKGGLERLEAHGTRADVIVLQQVLEHVLDPVGDLRRLRALLTPEGLLFIGTPGLYTSRRSLLFQNAHVWQFTTDTLTYLMQLAGFEEMYLDERIWSLWRAVETSPDDLRMPNGEGRQALRYLQTGERSLPLVKTLNKFPMRTRKANLSSALSRGLPDVSEITGTESGRALVIGGGPSIDNWWDHIRAEQSAGARIVAIDRMSTRCLALGIRPDYVLTLDASSDVLESFERFDPATVHLIATQCPPAVFDRLATARVYVFNTSQRGIELGDFWQAGNYERMTMLNAGGSVTIGAMAAAMALGMRDLQVFGFDCHVGAGCYATGIAGAGQCGQTIQVRIDDRVFTTTYSYLSFAQQFHLLKELGVRHGQLGQVRIYGDSLAAAMSVADIRGRAEVSH